MQVSVKTLKGQLITFDDLQRNDTIEFLKNKVGEVTGLPPKSLHMVFAGRLLRDEETFVDSNMGSGATVHLVHGVRSVVIVKTLTGKTIQIGPVEPTDTIEAIKDLVERSQGIPPMSQRLIFAERTGEDKQLRTVVFEGGACQNNARTLTDCGIQDGSVLHLILSLRS